MMQVEVMRSPEVRSSSIGKGWYVIYTGVGVETRVCLELKVAGFGYFLPCETRAKNRNGRRWKVRRPVFPRYAFVQFDPDRDDWYGPIYAIDGVQGVLENNKHPVRVPGHVIEELRRAEENGAFDKDKLPTKGERLLVANGLWAGRIGKVIAAKPNGRIKLLLKMMERAVAVEFVKGDLERL